MHAAAGSVQVILCGNGLAVNAPATARLAALPALSRLERALFFCGFERDASASEGTTIRHRGGSEVAHAPVFSRPGVGFQAPQGRMRWRSAPDARALELEKFFVNLVLAARIGPVAERNGTLRSLLPENQAAALARAFAAVGASEGLDAERLRTALWSTVDATAGNVNSLSLAGSAGRDDTFQHFLAQGREWMQAHLVPEAEGALLGQFLLDAENRWKGAR